MITVRPRFKPSHTWLVASAVTACLIALAVLAWRFMPVGAVDARQPQRVTPFIALEQQGDSAAMTRDQSLLMDSAPLFLPTRWSTSLAGRVVGGDSGTTADLFAPFASEVVLDASMLRPSARTVSIGPAKPAMYDDMNVGYLIGRRDDVQKALVLPQRGAFYEVRPAGGGKAVISGSIDTQIAEAGDLVWQPVEFWVRVVQEGVVGVPLLANGSGSDSLDAVLRTIVTNNRKLADLPPGYYRIVIGP
jgi:hypothetical protein